MHCQLDWFRIDTTAEGPGKTGYNDVVRWMYDALYKMNVEVDFIEPSCKDMDRYQMVIVPALYAACEADLQRMKQYVADGGYLITTFKTAYTDENVKFIMMRFRMYSASAWHFIQQFHFPEKCETEWHCR